MTACPHCADPGCDCPVHGWGSGNRTTDPDACYVGWGLTAPAREAPAAPTHKAPAPSIYHHVTDWIGRGGESYRYALPPPDALAGGALQVEAVCRATPIGWTVWALDRSRIVEMGPEQGEAGRILADEAARRVRWVLP